MKKSSLHKKLSWKLHEVLYTELVMVEVRLYTHIRDLFCGSLDLNACRSGWGVPWFFLLPTDKTWELSRLEHGSFLPNSSCVVKQLHVPWNHPKQAVILICYQVYGVRVRKKTGSKSRSRYNVLLNLFI